MKCYFCDNEANTQLSVFINGQRQDIYVCPTCFQEKFQDFMGWMQKMNPNEIPEEMLNQNPEDQPELPENMTEEFMDFVNLLGGKLANGLTEALQQAGTEEGADSPKAPGMNGPQGPRTGNGAQLNRLRRRRRYLARELMRAVESENYEKALDLRNELKILTENHKRLMDMREEVMK